MTCSSSPTTFALATRLFRVPGWLAIAEVSLSRPRIPVISNVDAQPHDDPEEIRALLVRQVVEPVRWESSMRYLLDQGFDSFYEIGPGSVLKGLLKRINRKTPCENVGV